MESSASVLTPDDSDALEGTDLDSRYQVTSRREVVRLLNGICEHRPLVSLMYGADHSFLTALLAVDEDDQSIVLDAVVDPAVNDRAVRAGRVSLRTMLDNIRIIVPIRGLRACRRDNRPALCADLPESLVRLQRRENYRIQTPMGKPAQATIPLDGTAGNSSVRIPLFDISCGGVALIEEAAVLDATIGHEYPQCRIDLPGIGVIDATLEVRDSREFTLRNGAWRRRIGCQFKNPSSSVLAAINRYIMKLERELNARRADLE